MNLDDFKNMIVSAQDSTSLHFSLGMKLRNEWNLWEDDENKKSDLVKFFNSIDIYHADDMSGIILESYRRFQEGKPLDIEEQVTVYKEHWKKYGYKDGIFREDHKEDY